MRPRSEATAFTSPSYQLPIGSCSVPAGIEHAAAVRPVHVGLESLHRIGVRLDPLALVRLFDAPVDHVAQSRKLPDLLLELRELMQRSGSK
jgi:hypothetical protein